MNTQDIKSKPVYRKWWFWLLIIIILRAFILYDKPSDITLKVPDNVMKSIQAEISKADKYFELGKVEMLDTGTIQIYVNLKFDPVSTSEVGKWTNNFVDAIGKANNYDLNLRISAVKPIKGTDKIKYYGTSTFYKESGKIEFKDKP